MNLLGIDYGTKRIGLAIAINGVISPLSVIVNDSNSITKIQEAINQHHIHKVYVGVSEGHFAVITRQFVEKLTHVLKLPVETIEEAVSTIEAGQIYRQNRGKNKHYQDRIDAISAAVILNRLLI